jgi:hypothetical protein
MIRSPQQLADHSVDDLADPGESGNPASGRAEKVNQRWIGPKNEVVISEITCE